MAKKHNNQIKAGSGFSLSGEYPIDDRLVVESYNDLTILVSGQKDDDGKVITGPCAYEGMQVYVTADKKTYEYKNISTTTDATLEWKAIAYKDDLTAEKTRAEEVEATLDTKISVEQLRATSAEDALGKRIDNLYFKDPTASGDTISFIDTISQTDGLITATKKTITPASTSTPGIVQLSNDASSTADNVAATPKGVQAAINALDFSAPEVGTSGTTTATAFIDSISQTDGKISATKKKLPNYAGSSSQGGPANKVANALTIQLNGGTKEGTDKFTFNGSAAKTVNITSPGVDRGIEKSGNNFVLNQAFYDYLLKQTFNTPSINSFWLKGTNVSGSIEVGKKVEVTSILHSEDNIDNISGNLTLSRSSGAGVTAKTLSNSITKNSAEVSVDVSDSFTATSSGTVTYTLSAPYTDTEGVPKSATKTAFVSFYWPVFYGATGSATPSNQTGLSNAGSSFGSNMLKIPTDATNKHLHFLSTDTITLYNSLKLPITPSATGTVSITVNGQKTTYNYATIQDCSAGTQQIYVNVNI